MLTWGSCANNRRIGSTPPWQNTCPHYPGIILTLSWDYPAAPFAPAYMPSQSLSKRLRWSGLPERDKRLHKHPHMQARQISSAKIWRTGRHFAIRCWNGTAAHIIFRTCENITLLQGIRRIGSAPSSQNSCAHYLGITLALSQDYPAARFAPACILSMAARKRV